MDFTLSDEQLAVAEAARAIAEAFGRRGTGESSPAAQQSPAGQLAPGQDRLWREIARSDLLGFCLPEEFGGSGGDLVGLCLLLEECGRGLAQAPVLETTIAALAIDRFGTVAQRKRWLPAAREGSSILTIAAVRGPAPLRAAQQDGRWLLTGEQPFVSYLPVAERVLITADAGGRNIALLVDPRGPGAEVILYTTTSGLPEGGLRLDNAAGEILDGHDGRDGHEGHDRGDGHGQDGQDIGRWIWDRAVVATSALLTGVASGALAASARYTSEREQFGRVLATFQAVALHAGDGFIDVEAMRLAAWQAAWRLSADWPADREISIAKFWASEGASRVTEIAQHLHGGTGVATDYPLHRYLLWSRQLELSLGSATWHLGRLAEQLA